MTRWQQFYLDDERVLSAPPSACARYALEYFRGANIKTILDLGCGVGRDTMLFLENGLQVFGLDAATSGLTLAQRRIRARTFPFKLVQADARCLPLPAASFWAIYCFGLLHEFVGDSAKTNVQRVMSEVERVLMPGGRLILAVVAGEPEQGLPDVQNFTEGMFDQVTSGFECIEKRLYNDVGCTGRTDYKVWRGTYEKVE